MRLCRRAPEVVAAGGDFGVERLRAVFCLTLHVVSERISSSPDVGCPLLSTLGACSRSRRLFVEWHKHKGMVRFYRKFFRYQYPGALMWLVTLGVWLRFSLVAMSLTVRRLLDRLVFLVAWLR